MNLNEHGAACRCLLRLRENEGWPGISDTAFINRFLPRYPEWRTHPGATDALMVLELARELRLADNVEMFRDYDHILQEHRAGKPILVYTERSPEQVESPARTGRYVMLVVDMTEREFTLWCPYASGNSEILPVAAREWWDRWLAIGVVLQRAKAAA
jgi:hypothetical protein